MANGRLAFDDLEDHRDETLVLRPLLQLLVGDEAIVHRVQCIHGTNVSKVFLPGKRGAEPNATRSARSVGIRAPLVRQSAPKSVDVRGQWTSHPAGEKSATPLRDTSYAA